MNINRELVVQDNKLIEAYYTATLTEIKLFNLLVSKVKGDDIDFKDYEFTSQELLEYLNIGKENHSFLEKTVQKFLGKIITIVEPKRIIRTTILSAAVYTKEGKIIFHFDPVLKPYLLQLKSNFTVFQLENILRLRSYFSVRLYELLKQYETIGKSV